MNTDRPIIWSIAGTDSGGGAGLAADQRAADAFGVHLCSLVAAVTAQHSRAVTHVEPVSPALLDAQWRALAEDLPPRVVKTGLLGSVEHVHAVAAGIDRLRADGPVALVVDPVLGATTGARFAGAEVLAAYRTELLPRATVVTPNRAEALALAGEPTDGPCPREAVPALAARLRAMGAGAVCITGGDSLDAHAPPLALDWLASPHAEGWLALPREAQPHHHGSGCTFATALAAALALGFVEADAAVLAKMATTHAIRRGYAAGGGAGPVNAAPGFAADPSLLPQLSWDTTPAWAAPRDGAGPVTAAAPLGLYAITDRAEAVPGLLAAGVRTLQLRIKTPEVPDAAWGDALAASVRSAVAACRAAGALLFVNDHWRVALACGAEAVHLGQEDLLALGPEGRAALSASGLALGISSHSLWELCRARSLAPRCVACGPVWPTLTKAMPWRPQGLHNLAWWRAMAGAPVVAIGGVLDADRVRAAAASGADGVCVVRAVDRDAAAQVPPLQRALHEGRWAPPAAVPALPQPSLAGPAG